MCALCSCSGPGSSIDVLPLVLSSCCLAFFSKLLQLLILSCLHHMYTLCAHPHGNQLFTCCVCMYASCTYYVHVCTTCTHCVHMHMEIRGQVGVSSLLPQWVSKNHSQAIILTVFRRLLPDVLASLSALKRCTSISS